MFNSKSIVLPAAAPITAVNNKAKATHVTLRVFFSPDLVLSHLEKDRHDFREDDKNEIKRREQHAFSSTMGFLVGYNLKGAWSLQAGLTLSNIVTTITPKTIYARYDNDGRVRFRFNSSSGYSYLPVTSVAPPSFGDSLKAFTSKNELQYVAIPLSVKYNISTYKFDFYPTAGIAANILTKQKLETTVSNGLTKESATVHNISGLKPGYFNGLLGLGIAYKINRNMAISLAPAARFALTAINEKAPVKSYPLTFSLAAGLQWKL